METRDIDNRFTYHVPHKADRTKYEKVREETRLLAFVINDLCPESREKSLAITKLEEAVFWANAAIAREEDKKGAKPV